MIKFYRMNFMKSLFRFNSILKYFRSDAWQGKKRMLSKTVWTFLIWFRVLLRSITLHGKISLYYLWLNHWNWPKIEIWGTCLFLSEERHKPHAFTQKDEMCVTFTFMPQNQKLWQKSRLKFSARRWISPHAIISWWWTSNSVRKYDSQLF